MTQKNIKTFINEIYSKGPKRNYATNKTNVYDIDDVWSFDILDLKDYGPENNHNYRYVLVVIDNFSYSFPRSFLIKFGFLFDFFGIFSIESFI